MESAPPSTPSKPSAVETALGGTIALLLLPGRSILALVPIWSVLCGAWMAFLHAEPGVSSPQALLALLLAVSIVGVLWSTWRALLVDVDWAACFRRYPLPAPQLLSGLPYTTPWSPLGRLLARSSQMQRWTQEAPIEMRGAWYTTLVLPALILVLSALVGWPTLVISLAALALSLVEWRVSVHSTQRSQTTASLRAGMQVGLGWLAGHVTLAPLTWTAVALACCSAIAYQGALGLAQQALKPDRRTKTLLLLYGGQIALQALLALLGHPLTAAFAVFLLAPQWLLLVGFGHEHKTEPTHQPAYQWYLKRALPFCMLAMLAAAWAPG